MGSSFVVESSSYWTYRTIVIPNRFRFFVYLLAHNDPYNVPILYIEGSLFSFAVNTLSCTVYAISSMCISNTFFFLFKNVLLDTELPKARFWPVAFIQSISHVKEGVYAKKFYCSTRQYFQLSISTKRQEKYDENPLSSVLYISRVCIVKHQLHGHKMKVMALVLYLQSQSNLLNGRGKSSGHG